MTATDLAYIRTTSRPLEVVIARLGEELKKQGFGVLATIDVSKVLREKIGAEVRPLTILEVCSPKHAKMALDVGRDVSLLLPCKIVVSTEGKSTRIALQRPTVVMGALMPLPGLQSLGIEVEKTLSGVIDRAA